MISAQNLASSICATSGQYWSWISAHIK